MEKPSNLLLKLSRSLFADTAEQEKFIHAVTHPQAFNPAILWLQPKPTENPFDLEIPVSWQPEFVDRLALESQPGKHSLHQAGHYYCLDFSSIFAASTLLTTPQPIKLILDMCAAPGGKSIFAWKTLNPELLLCNEVIGKRMGMLISNLRRCQINPSAAANVDSKILAEKMAQTANLVIVDAPCTGQSLLAKGDKAPGCFHHVTINSNANRQKRILANSAKIVAPQGYLAYMTCTYSTAENEQVSEWLLSKFPEFQPVTVPHLEKYRSHLTEIPSYRMWPQDRLGAGAFTVLFQNTSDGERNQLPADFRDLARFTNL
ncbi:RsmB/NOP family class I SAM-dependent RNA methyltransferase [Microcoleus vaginatus DQ-U2]|uniref:RsmB/NOP family class I SAM-dependent RNA methyltransferase n=1 Tax=Microcoleus vaginatus TaxID=119532 RepID=UPI001689BC61|nr:RsmB/NOP family class I SAM-dependent RNA methyltransferase [Microcoleus sp. FACHB-DQ6]